MEYMDETILKNRQQKKDFDEKRFSIDAIEEEIKQSITSENITIYGVPVRFLERSILENRISISMPTDFEELSEEDIALIYPLGNPPKVLYGNTYIDLSIGFNHSEHSIPEEMLGEFSKVVQTMMERSGPKVKFYGRNMMESEEHKISSLEFISHTITETVYNLMFFSVLEDRVLIGFINFNHKNSKRCKPIAKEILESFKFIKEDTK